jgi:hypothetical protein
MSDEATAPVSGGSEPAPVVTPGNADLAGGDYSVADALASLRKKSAPDTNSTAESAPAATADKESVVEADAAPRETEATSEVTEEPTRLKCRHSSFRGLGQRTKLTTGTLYPAPLRNT